MEKIIIVPWLGNSDFITDQTLNKLLITSAQYLKNVKSRKFVLDGLKIFVEVRASSEAKLTGLFNSQELIFFKVISTVSLYVANVNESSIINKSVINLKAEFMNDDRLISEDAFFVFET
jgi:hypothetical protein